MNAGISRILPSRPLLPRRKFMQPAFNQAYAHALSGHTSKQSSPTPDAMLNRASQKYQATATSAVPAKADLAKELFPSSSPATQDGNIANWASKKGRGGFQSSAGSGSSKAAGPLKPICDNPLRLPSKPRSSITSFAQPTNRMASLYTSTSFEVPATSGSTVTSVYIADEDFSDDDNLELDYECLASLPSLPPPKPVKLSPVERLPKPPSPVPAVEPSSSQIPWSSSPHNHFFPPHITRKPSLKRESPVNKPPSLPPAKKRVLPKDFKTVKEHESLATPAAKPTLPWNTTYSATKEKKKQLKNLTKKSEGEDIRSATDSHTGPGRSSAISLSTEQQHILELVVQKKQSVFFTGPAGTGKSVLMRAIIAEMKKKWARDPERLSITASTGLAACNIGGQTLHSFAGIGLGKEDVPTLVRKIRRNPKAKNKWLRTSVLVIDEVSMVDGELFDKLAQIARTIRNNGRPWGGIQLVITGDFFQLPPVPDSHSGKKTEARFAFDAATWNTSIDHTIGLTQVFRQRDPEFANMLNEMRLGRISDTTIQAFNGLNRPLNFGDGLDVTELFPTRQEVERSNEMRLRNLGGELHRFEATDSGDPNVRDKLLQNMMAPKTIDLRKGAQVMLIKNLDDSLVNGSLGIVKGFMSEAVFEVYAGHEGSGGEADEDGRAKKKIKAFSRESDATRDMREYPLVRFTGIDGTHRNMLMQPEDWKVELPNGEIQAQRRQLPLILAWALSIHKAQGQTLERVKVDLGKVFEKGQAYVALSRATSQQGLQVLNFNKSKVQAHPRVIQFYNKLYSAESAMKKKAPTTMSDFVYKGPSNSVAVPKSTSSTRKGVNTVDLDDEEEAMAAAYG